MNEKNLELLEKIKDTLSEIQGLREDLEIVSEIAGIVRRAEMKEAPADAANTGEGGAEQSLTAVSASIVHKNEEDCQYGT